MTQTLVESLNASALAAMLASEEAASLCLLDVRTLQEYVYNGHLPGATLIPLDELLERAHEELDPSQAVVVICEHGVRSAHAAMALAQLGFRRVYDYTDGMADWSGARVFDYPANRPYNRTVAHGLSLTPAR